MKVAPTRVNNNDDTGKSRGVLQAWQAWGHLPTELTPTPTLVQY